MNNYSGLCFSVKKGVPCPPSLVNIYKEVKANYASTFKIPNHGNLDGWSKQGESNSASISLNFSKQIILIY